MLYRYQDNDRLETDHSTRYPGSASLFEVHIEISRIRPLIVFILKKGLSNGMMIPKVTPTIEPNAISKRSTKRSHRRPRH